MSAFDNVLSKHSLRHIFQGDFVVFQKEIEVLFINRTVTMKENFAKEPECDFQRILKNH